eukprot:54814_1
MWHPFFSMYNNYKVTMKPNHAQSILAWAKPGTIVFEIAVKMLMDDLTLYTRYNWVDNPLNIEDKGLFDQFWNKQLSIRNFLKFRSIQHIIKPYLYDAAIQFDTALDLTHQYLNWSNIPT